ncbi:MAG TPA: response regulator transcription factor [Candidatus Dormibacteraeota bacterium]|nr:response regulator transcription factor [Candidatus Dormibacteraeota bacterium]
MQKNVLIVDDHPHIRRATRAIFENEPGFAVCGEAASGRDAIEKARELRPDLIILDFSMPGMNGLEAARLLKKILPEVPVIMLTAHENAFSDLVARAAGISAVVSKDNSMNLVSQARVLLNPN